uniref:Uncharacterized protein n=1 Tax=Candidatus Kentrum sp. TC TaxID=2126339 RepID=A0A450ZEJ4_9GAMM|nr:MAG: hypothetical protein BECKTC1821E_GA0114239_11314 [Candidatus Kentron sp. TC]VFK52178.1 MAG: hypothetical protein BECKTC1821D_GA0114238_11563 [Candidatus Kentron sp. TC]VFK64550.1 MAG: hypothetical protein BECKTC1821F_GA0114240_11313 [Candidatus Kentron sp. TC]
MNQKYYDSIDKMEKMGVNKEYIHGWIGGFIENPKREEQRITEAYDAGYEDGKNKDESNFGNWTGK